jgi:hypothetical protein
MKRRIVIPSSAMRPWPGESPADAIRRATLGRSSRELTFERGEDDKDENESSLSTSQN